MTEPGRGCSPRVTRVEVLAFHRQLDGQAWNPSFRWHERRAPLLVVHTDAGVAGVGEAWSPPLDPAPVLTALAQEVAPALLGQRLDTLPGVLARAWAPGAGLSLARAAATSAADVACRDALARHRGEPLWRALGGRDGGATVYASGGLYRGERPAAGSARPPAVAAPALAELAAEMAGYVAQGHRAVKMKVGALSLAEDMARVHAVRDAIGPDVRLWVDAVNQLRLPQALDWCAALREAGVSALQAPLPFEDVQGMHTINHAGLPVVATEAEYRPDVFADLLDVRAVGYLQFCVGLCGGFTGALGLDVQARARGVRTTPQTYSTAVMQAASLHLAAARSNVDSAEWHGFHDHLRALMPESMRTVRGGVIALGEAPGLGIAIPQAGTQPDGSRIDVFHTCALPS